MPDKSRQPIVLIEKNKELRFIAESVIRASGYQVFSAGDGFHGLAMIHEFRPCIVVTELFASRIDGINIAHIVNRRSELASLPFIFLNKTAIPSEETELGLSSFGRVLTLPLIREELIHAIKVCLQSSGTED